MITSYLAARQKKVKGFTLSELLIALSILGVIAAFTIPKILQSSQEGQKKAILKEAYSSVTNLFIEGRNNGQIRANTSNDFINYIASHLNYAKRVYEWDIDPECWSVSENGQLPYDFTGTSSNCFQMHNGANVFIWRLEYSPTMFMIDWNGTKPPNILGQDVLWVWQEWDTLRTSSDASSQSLYDSLWAS